MTPFLEIVSGIIELAHLEQVDKEGFDNEAGEKIRERMDDFFRKLTPEQIEISQQISALIFEGNYFLRQA